MTTRRTPAGRFFLASMTLFMAAFVVGAFPPATAQISAQKPASAPPTQDYDPTQSRASRIEERKDGLRGLIWEVKTKDGANTAYLFGTIHVGKPSFYPLPRAVQMALLASNKIVVEADVTDQSEGSEIAKIVDYPKGETIERHISPQLFARLKAQLEKRKIPYANVSAMRPVILGGMLPIVEYVQLGYDMNSGLDMALIKRAKQEKKPLLQLESSLAQIKLLTSMPAALQESFLDNALSIIEQGRSADQVTGIVNAWQAGDPKLMLELADEVSRGQKDAEKLNQVLLWGRHPAMMQKIESYLASGETHFIAVGSLHLVGPKGLVNLLAQKGYLVRQ
ncbi:MAG: TraB/GumN family protein, partial [Burkholderiales bacterium]